eukprot:TRINITY_DN1335_c2_g1_i1.p1 TRINITY_DN1335_c2_g1~~TRINITY_DN1335_c2_g1_i1.p1  ORF type:complete len:1278 (+),score=183.33 TRINITY_DN1335_c2_g1_i1:38-3835(+)
MSVAACLTVLCSFSSVPTHARDAISLQACATSKQPWCGAGGSDCKDMVSPTTSCKDYTDLGYSCSTLVGDFKKCTECTCAPGTWDPDATPAPASTGRCTGVDECKSSLGQGQIDSLLRKINEFRTKHGACPLTYSTTIADDTIKSTGFDQTCTTGTQAYNTDFRYTEAIAIHLGTDDVHNFIPSVGPEVWYCRYEGCWDYTTSSGQGAELFTAMVWKASTEVGCGVCHRKSGTQYTIFLMCSFGPAGNIRNEYRANVGAVGDPLVGCAPTVEDECIAGPCQLNQTCSDPDHSIPFNFVCSCDEYPSVTGVGFAPVCVNDECASRQCAQGQTCMDTYRASNSLNNWRCVCDYDASVYQDLGDVGECPRDECKESMWCGPVQVCSDPQPTPTSLDDYVCACDNGVTTIGKAAICEINECDAVPCGQGQACADVNVTSTSLYDYTCTCLDQPNITRTGLPAGCSRDECLDNPCAGKQTCKDPNPSPLSTADFTCTCVNGVVAVGRAAACDGNECSLLPCGDQTCADPAPMADSYGDFICTCVNDSRLQRVGQPVAACAHDECAAQPCGGQACTDPDTSTLVVGDFICACSPHSNITNTGAPALCADGAADECTSFPCGASQTCTDPNRTAASTKDYICTCRLGTGLAGVGTPAACSLDECEAVPCGSGQLCRDPDTSVSSSGDFTCLCPSPLAGSMRGTAALCTLDECVADPCGEDQSCNDPTTSATSVGDYMCTCNQAPTVSVRGGVAVCAVDECVAGPCGEQLCNDPDTSVISLSDYQCTCMGNTSITARGAPATCTVDECSLHPCGSQECRDSNTDPSSLNDFECVCPNGVTAPGTPAQCTLDECETQPCAQNQLCTDGNTLPTSLGDYVCSCVSDSSVSRTGGVAPCLKDECEMKPCGDDQLCLDPNNLPSNFVCTCMHNQSVSSVGQASNCGVDECTAYPCGPGQICLDPNTTGTLDFECWCPSGGTPTVGAAAQVCDECVNDPCQLAGTSQTCTDPKPSADALLDYVCTCANGAQQTGRPAQCDTAGECATSPCTSGQACGDPAPGTDGDFVCACAGGRSVGRPMLHCVRNECNVPADAPRPCPPEQTCVDLNTSIASLYDFVCTCRTSAAGNAFGEAVGKRAVCSPTSLGAATPTHNECDSGPSKGACGSQQCSDPTGFSNLSDFACSCGTVTQMGAPVPDCKPADEGSLLLYVVIGCSACAAITLLAVLLVVTLRRPPHTHVNQFFADANGSELEQPSLSSWQHPAPDPLAEDPLTEYSL